ncbi:hypothetical protein OIU79_026269 [Salix purpurea]|uniref:Uncharacterized protein n=1 Tax=Salix purpurea TaxID=77065 RepID=A0A9Q1A0H1_SALPP|nr:hypothetical protein OIU79_026269 [Salix purpurea]
MLFSAESAVTAFFIRSVLAELCSMRHAEREVDMRFVHEVISAAAWVPLLVATGRCVSFIRPPGT